ncbi:MAG TPA: response regulator [Pyrinomonadaceae bacterium]|nr:response regulator [Pyrinomonadaceae bacterium]
MKDSAHKTSPKKRILCVEDDRDTCDLLSVLFSEYEVVFAASLQEAFALIENQHFDLYVLDNWLPDGSGIEVCRRIHELKPEVPIIFTSAVGQKSEIKKALDAGAREYLVKPYEPENLQKIVKELIAETAV